MIWIFNDHPLQIEINWSALIPNLNNPDQIALLSGVMLSMLGIEMSAIHANDVENPQKNYPKSILYSFLAVILFSTLGVLSIAFVVPKNELLVNAGCLHAFSYFLNTYHLSFILPFVVFLLGLAL